MNTKKLTKVAPVDKEQALRYNKHLSENSPNTPEMSKIGMDIYKRLDYVVRHFAKTIAEDGWRISKKHMIQLLDNYPLHLWEIKGVEWKKGVEDMIHFQGEWIWERFYYERK